MAVEVTEAKCRTEHAAALTMVDDLIRHGIRLRPLGADRGYDSGPLLLEPESRAVTPHTAMRCEYSAGSKARGVGSARIARASPPVSG